MPEEIEIKLRLADPAALRNRLKQLGGEFLGCVHEINRLYDTPDRRLLAADSGLRLRENTPLDEVAQRSAKLTFKGPARMGRAKIREEIQTTVGDAAILGDILSRLELLPFVLYEKHRERWSLDGCDIAIDEMPKLGWFVEVEGPDEDAVDRVKDRLQLDPAAIVLESYPRLTAENGVPDPTGCRCLRF